MKHMHTLFKPLAYHLIYPANIKCKIIMHTASKTYYSNHLLCCCVCIKCVYMYSNYTNQWSDGN